MGPKPTNFAALRLTAAALFQPISRDVSEVTVWFPGRFVFVHIRSCMGSVELVWGAGFGSRGARRADHGDGVGASPAGGLPDCCRHFGRRWRQLAN